MNSGFSPVFLCVLWVIAFDFRPRLYRFTFSIFQKKYAMGYAPSLPSITSLREDKAGFMLERSNFEGRDSAAIAAASNEISMLRGYLGRTMGAEQSSRGNCGYKHPLD
jgi:hypothetical protein